MEQIGHQGTCYSSAYAAVPHLLELAKVQSKLADPWFYASLGSIAEPAEQTEEVPEDVRAEFEAAMAEAAALALDAVLKQTYGVEDFVYLLQGAAALYHRRGPGIWLSGLIQNNFEAYCPSCDSYLSLKVEENRIDVIAEDERCRPLSASTQVVARSIPDTVWDLRNQPEDDFSWLCALCLRTEQKKVLTWISYLYGKAHCPTCHATFALMSQIENESGME